MAWVVLGKNLYDFALKTQRMNGKWLAPQISPFILAFILLVYYFPPFSANHNIVCPFSETVPKVGRKSVSS